MAVMADDEEYPASLGATITIGLLDFEKKNGPDPSGYDRDAEKRTKLKTPYRCYSLDELRYVHEIKQQFDEQAVVDFLNPDDQEHSSSSSSTDDDEFDLCVEDVEILIQLRPCDIEPEPSLGGASSSSSGTRARVEDPLAELSGGRVLKRPRMDLVSTEESVIQNLNPATDSSSEA